LSIGEIASRLTHAGIPTRTGKPRQAATAPASRYPSDSARLIAGRVGRNELCHYSSACASKPWRLLGVSVARESLLALQLDYGPQRTRRHAVVAKLPCAHILPRAVRALLVRRTPPLAHAPLPAAR